MSRLSIIPAILFFLIFSCSNTDPDPVVDLPEVFINLTVGEDFLDSGSEHYLFFTDADNDLLDYSRIANNNSYQFERASSSVGEAYDYHILTVARNGGSSRFRMNTKRNLLSTELSLEKAPSGASNLGSSLGRANVEFINIPTHDLFNLLWPDANNTGVQFNSTNSGIELFENIRDYYVYLRNGQSGLFKEGSLTAGDQVIDLTSMSSEMDLFRVQVPGNISTLAVSAQDSRYSNISRPFFLHFGPFTEQGNLSDVSFHLPSERSHLSNYFTFLTVSGDNGAIYRSTANSVNNLIVPDVLDAEIVVDALEVDGMTINTTGDFDILEVNLSKGDFYWNISTDNSSSRFDRFPSLPSELAQLVPEFSKDAFTSIDDYSIKLSKIDETSDTMISRSIQRNKN